MPLELGIFLGAKRFGNDVQAEKHCLITASERYEYQKYISDVAGQDIEAHNNEARTFQRVVRDWLVEHASDPLPTATVIWDRHETFESELEVICRQHQQRPHELTYRDYLLHVGRFCSHRHNVLTTGTGKRLENPSRREIANALESLPGGTDSFAILEKAGAGLTYLQTLRESRQGYVLELQEGSTDRHFRATGEFLSAQQVIGVFCDYSEGSTGWRDRFEWKRLDL